MFLVVGVKNKDTERERHFGCSIHCTNAEAIAEIRWFHARKHLNVDFYIMEGA